MLRKLAAAGVLVMAGMLAAAGTASAAPTYGPPALSVESLGGSQFGVIGSNFGSPDGADDYVEVVADYSGASGLRYSQALASAAVADSFRAVPDAEGYFTGSLVLNQPGTVTVTAVGFPSGDTVAVTIELSGQSVVVADGSNNGQVSGTVSGKTWTGSGDTWSLANTGASVAGPIAVGVIVLLLGFGLLYLGTRGVVIRRRETKSTVDS